MPLLPPNFPANLDPSQPLGTDSRTISDDEHRNAKSSLQMTFPNINAAVTPTPAEINKLGGMTASTADLNTVTGEDAKGGVYMKGTSGTTIALFLNSTAPPGWVITTAYDGRMLVVKGTINGSTVAGGSTGGTDDPGINDKLINHRHFVVSSFTGSGDTNPVDATTQVQRFVQANNDRDYNLRGRTEDATLGRSSQEGNTSTGWVPRFGAAIACTLQ